MFHTPKIVRVLQGHSQLAGNQLITLCIVKDCLQYIYMHALFSCKIRLN